MATHLKLYPIDEMIACEPSPITSNPTLLIIQSKSRRLFSFRCRTGWLFPKTGTRDLVLLRRTDSTPMRGTLGDSDREGWNVSWLKSRCSSWRLEFEKLKAWFIRPWRYFGLVFLVYEICIHYFSMSYPVDEAEYANQLFDQIKGGRSTRDKQRCESCRHNKKWCDYPELNPQQRCAACVKSNKACGPKVFSDPVESQRIKDDKQFHDRLRQAANEKLQQGWSHDDILRLFDTPNTGINIPPQLTPNPYTTFSPLQQAPQTPFVPPPSTQQYAGPYPTSDPFMNCFPHASSPTNTPIQFNFGDPRQPYYNDYNGGAIMPNAQPSAPQPEMAFYQMAQGPFVDPQQTTFTTSNAPGPQYPYLSPAPDNQSMQFLPNPLQAQPMQDPNSGAYYNSALLAPNLWDRPPNG